MKNNILHLLILISIAIIGLSNCSTNEQKAYRDSSLSIEERVDDLISKMTLPEKIGQMTQVARDYIQDYSE